MYRSWKAFLVGRKAGAAVEFAFCGVALVGFFVALLNLALLGLNLGALAHGVQMTGRWAVIQATSSYAASYATSGTTFTEPCLGSIVTAFNHYSSPPMQILAQPASNTSPNGTTTTKQLSLIATWSPNGNAGSAPGIYLTLTGTYTWSPFGFGDFPIIKLPLKITTAASVIGSSTAGVSVSSKCS